MKEPKNSELNSKPSEPKVTTHQLLDNCLACAPGHKAVSAHGNQLRARQTIYFQMTTSPVDVLSTEEQDRTGVWAATSPD